MPIDKKDRQYRDRAADLVRVRLMELELAGQKLTYEQLAARMGEYGKEAVIRILNGDRPITLSLVEKLATGLRLDLGKTLELLTGATSGSSRAAAADVAYRSLVAAFGAKAAGNVEAVRAARAIADLDDTEARRWLAQIVEGYAANHQRMSGQRAALIHRPAVDQEGGQ